MKKILITGSNGFIGRNLKEFLEDKYITISPSHKELDLCNTEQVEAFLKESKIDVVIHSANTNNTRNEFVENYEVINNNLRMFFNLKRCNKYFQKMLYFGSGAEYNMDYYIPYMKEEYFGKYVPKDSYGFSKYIMSNSISDVDNIFDLRLFGVYGKYEEWERRFISNNIYRVIIGLPISIRQNMFFDYLYIDDLELIIKWFIDNEPFYKHYNICRGKSMDLYSIAKLIKKIMNSPYKIEVLRGGLKKEYSGCNERMINEIGVFSFTDMEDSIKKLIDYYNKNKEIFVKK